MRSPLLSLVVAAFVASASAAGGQDLPDLTDRDLFDDSTLHTIRLVINPRDWEDLKANYQTNDYYACHLLWRDRVVRNVGIRSRGTGSRSGTKPGLRVDFNLYDEPQRFVGLKSLVLRNNTQDPSQLHERLAMQFFERMGLPAPRQAHARLVVNDEYVGLYSLVEPVDKVFLGRHFQQENGFLYEYDYDADDPPYRFELRGTSPQLYSPKPFKPVTHETDPSPGPIVDMVRAINETSNADFTRVMADHLDLERFVTHVAVESFLSEMDGVLGEWGMNNFYLYRFEGSVRSTLIPWDKSEAFKGGVHRSIWHNVDDVPSWVQNRLMTRVMLVPALRRLYLETLSRCADVASAPEADDPLDEVAAEGERPSWLERAVMRGYEQIRQAALDDPAKPHSNDEFEAAVIDLLGFARERSAFVRREVERSPR